MYAAQNVKTPNTPPGNAPHVPLEEFLGARDARGAELDQQLDVLRGIRSRRRRKEAAKSIGRLRRMARRQCGGFDIERRRDRGSGARDRKGARCSPARKTQLDGRARGEQHNSER